jgi:NADH-quinone oxidoreductase subunit C
MADEFDRGLDDLETGPTATAGAETPREAPAAAEHASVTALEEKFGDAILHHEVQAGDEHVVFIVPGQNTGILRWLRDDPDQRYDFLADLTAVDYGGGRPIQVVYQLWSIRHKRALRLKAELPLDELEIETVVPIWSTANWLEREVYDLFGVEFRGHPDLRRIMMPDTYAEGHPLRKDFPLRGRFSRAEQTRRALSYDLAADYSQSELDVLKKRDWERTQERARKEGVGQTRYPEDRQDSRDARDTAAEGANDE